MFLDLKELKRKGVSSQDFFFEYTPTEELVNIPETVIVSPVKISGTVTLTDEHSAFVDGEVNFVLSGECTRCLTKTERAYLFGFEENCGIEDYGYPVVNDKIDLEKIVNDTIIMNIPITFLCKEDCKGICSECGVNLNNEQCKCK